MAILFGGIPLLVLLVAVIALNVSARKLEKRLSLLVRDQLDRVQHIEHAVNHLKGKAAPAETPTV